jgi:hypothetical protein
MTKERIFELKTCDTEDRFKTGESKITLSEVAQMARYIHEDFMQREYEMRLRAARP